MYAPTLEHTLSDHAQLLQDSHRCGVVKVTHGPDSENPALAQRPIHERPRRFSRVSLAPLGSGQMISETDLVVLSFLFSTEEVTLSGRVDAHRHKSHELAIFLALHNPGIRPIAFHRIQQVGEKCLGLLDILMRTPRQIPGHVGVAGITCINGRCICHSRFTQA